MDQNSSTRLFRMLLLILVRPPTVSLSLSKSRFTARCSRSIYCSDLYQRLLPMGVLYRASIYSVLLDCREWIDACGGNLDVIVAVLCW
ncbi:hypothetical protein LX36DRAFT_653386 [Colletotrichum falcatum]|nr:hypothetical protein LX36DRAFT_653386 [Colletotrichum falcatum]